MVGNVQQRRVDPWMVATIVLATILVLGLGWGIWMQNMCMQHCMNMGNMMEMDRSKMPMMPGQSK